MTCEYGCYVIGGGFIAENPECPVHGVNGSEYRIDKLERDLAAANAKVEEYRKDAERYRWLRTRDPYDDRDPVHIYVTTASEEEIIMDELDAAIDAAIAARENKQ